MRLTRLRNDGQFLRSNKNIDECINKLGQLEDIEEELGIDLIIFIRAILKLFVWVKYDYKIIQVGLCLFESENEYYFWGHDKIYFIKDYGKTWALTKEELEK